MISGLLSDHLQLLAILIYESRNQSSRNPSNFNSLWIMVSPSLSSDGASFWMFTHTGMLMSARDTARSSHRRPPVTWREHPLRVLKLVEGSYVHVFICVDAEGAS